MIATLWLACTVGGPLPADPPCLANPPPVPSYSTWEAFPVVAAPSDLLWVVDDGANGAGVQAALADAVPVFLDMAGDDPWRVAVLPTSRPQLATAGGRSFVEGGGATGSLPDLVRVGTEGDGPGGALANLLQALDAGALVAFRRPEVPLHVVVVSAGDDDGSVPDFADALAAREPSATLSVLGGGGSTFLDASDALDGLVLDELDWDGSLVRIGALAVGLRQEFFLSLVPISGTLEVEVETVDGARLHFVERWDFTLDLGRNSVRFLEYWPEAGGAVYADYVPASAPPVELLWRGGRCGR